jgi:hypothetical protein
VATKHPDEFLVRKLLMSFGGLTALSLGALSLVATGFLAYWDRASNGQHDISARGGFLLFALLPWFLFFTLMFVLCVAAVLLRRLGLGWLRIAAMTVIAFLVAALIEFLPPFLFERALALISSGLRPTADFVVASSLILAGAVAIARSSSPTPPNTR